MQDKQDEQEDKTLCEICQASLNPMTLKLFGRCCSTACIVRRDMLISQVNLRLRRLIEESRS
jgi:hypothetical protein